MGLAWGLQNFLTIGNVPPPHAGQIRWDFCGRLAWLHYWLGSDVLSPAEAAEQLFNIVSDFLLEFGLTKLSFRTTHGRTVFAASSLHFNPKEHTA